MDNYEYDAFISHASEDKADFVEPLAIALRAMGLKIWFDKFSLKVGDSLHDSIESGLANSRFGVVVFSPHFFVKNWPRAELRGLYSREIDGQKIILPIWHKVTRSDVLSVLPILADMVPEWFNYFAQYT